MAASGYRFRESRQQGFTLVEMMMVMAIIGVLITIGVKAYSENRKKTYDTQVISTMRNLLTRAETDMPQTQEAVVGENSPTDYPDVKLNPGMYLNIHHDATEDRWEFYLAHVGGQLGFYFWIPGEDCSVDTDSTTPPVPSDKIVPSFATKSVYPWNTFRTNSGTP